MNDERRTRIGEDAPVATGRFHRILMPLISLTLFFAAIAAIHHLLTEVSYPQLVAELKALSGTSYYSRFYSRPAVSRL
ncbi:MAG: hypothetical protein ACREVK_13860 [Gammaproteobacteria bacterium]